MTPREVIRRSHREDVPLLEALFHQAFGQDRPAEVWQWKYFGERDSVGYVCEVDGRVVAHCGGIPVRLRQFSTELPALQSVDFMSSPFYSGGLGGGGVFVRTVRRMFQECCGPDKVQIVYGFPGERHRIVGERLLGYRPLEPIHELILDSSSSSGSPEPLTEDALRPLTRFRFPVGAIRDESYLRWRYMRHPHHRYAVVRVRGSWPFRKLIVGLVRELDDHFALMEVAGIEDSSDAGRLTAALKLLGKPVKGWFPAKHSVGLFLAESGFKAVARDHHLEYRFFAKRPLPNEGDWYYTLGDYDVY